MAYIILATIISGIVLGLVWRWQIGWLIIVAICIGWVAGAIVADWSGIEFMFSSLNNFILVSLNYGGFFIILTMPIVFSALLTFLVKNRGIGKKDKNDSK